MPPDVPVDGRPVDAWLRFFWLWHVGFALDYAFTAWLVLSDGGPPAPRLTSVAAVAVLAILSAAFLGRALRRRGTVAFSVAMLAVTTVAVLADASAGFVLFSVCPIVSMCLTRVTAALLTSLAILLPPLSVLLRYGPHESSLAVLVPMSALMIVFSVCMGTWFGRVVRESQERGALIEQLEASRAEVARLSHEAGTSTERERLAREIHDTLAQGFTSILTLLQAVESEMDSDPVMARRHVELASRTARENLAEARTMVAALTPSALTTGSLAQAVRRQAERLAEETGIDVRCRIPDRLPALPTVTEVVLLRAAQEALSNVRKHAKANHVSLDLDAEDSLVRLIVTDDGVGFGQDGPARGFGLKSMRDRARQVGGTMTVRAGERTTVTVEVPA
ncbi:sensor histidine kinase [Amycolatopsis pigmentata]|uniref:Sensor histidine kinase n=1 Tax=Amycolatopsis pigmentata TaxID=450801 RepID=A0ABW5FXB0_9PSEU